MTTPTSVIYRYTNLTDVFTAGGFTDKIEFDVGVVPDATGHTLSTETALIRSLNENPKPKSNNPNEIQDNGLGQIPLTVVGTIEASEISLIEGTFITWMTNDQTNTNFPFGRFGIHLSDRPAWNTAPVTNATTGGGFLIQEIYSRKIPGFDKIDFIAKLRYNGNISWLGAGS